MFVLNDGVPAPKLFQICLWTKVVLVTMLMLIVFEKLLHGNLQLLNDRILKISHLSGWSDQMIRSVKHHLCKICC